MGPEKTLRTKDANVILETSKRVRKRVSFAIVGSVFCSTFKIITDKSGGSS